MVGGCRLLYYYNSTVKTVCQELFSLMISSSYRLRRCKCLDSLTNFSSLFFWLITEISSKTPSVADIGPVAPLFVIAFRRCPVTTRALVLVRMIVRKGHAFRRRMPVRLETRSLIDATVACKFDSCGLHWLRFMVYVKMRPFFGFEAFRSAGTKGYC